MRVWLLLVAWMALLPISAQAESNAKRFGSLPEFENVVVSPNGNQVAFIRREGSKQALIIRNLKKSKQSPQTANVSDLRIRGVEWANDEYLLLFAARTSFNKQYNAVFSVNAKTGKVVFLLGKDKELLRANPSLGTVLGVVPGTDDVLMPVHQRPSGSTERQYVLYQVNMGTGTGTVAMVAGNSNARQFVVGPTGEVVARMNYNSVNSLYTIDAIKDGKPETIFTNQGKRYPFYVRGVTPDGKSLYIASDLLSGSIYNALYEMNLADGAIHGPVQDHPGSDITGTIDNLSANQMEAIRFMNVKGAETVYLDPKLEAAWKKAQAKLNGYVLVPTSHSKDGNVWLVKAFGPGAAAKYVIYRADTDSLRILADGYPDIKPDEVGHQYVFSYPVGENANETAVLTMPPGAFKKPGPMVVMPHDGPNQYSSTGWNWMAQYLANEGYMVLQPNYRGSFGFGREFQDAGDGQWGGAVLADINAATQSLIDAGYADPKRICIAGEGFGGYLALAEVSMHKGIYRCAISISGVSDWRKMLDYVTRRYSASSARVADLRRRLLGPDETTNAADISPARLADAVQAPVLLIHGKDDLFVPYSQSEAMRNALSGANKSVEMVTLEGENHQLSTTEARIEALSAMGKFLSENLH